MIDMSGAILIQQRKQMLEELETCRRRAEFWKHVFYNVVAFAIISSVCMLFASLDGIMEILPI